jgi:5-methyltetrahydrofolate--homocysteine methyltransferase
VFDFATLRESLIKGDIEKTAELTQAALDTGVKAKEVLDKCLVPGLEEVGRRFQRGEYYFPELLVAGEAMKSAMTILKPKLGTKDGATIGRFVIGTVKSDIHDIGKNIVVMMLEGNGWDVTDLGVDVSSEQFVKAVKEGKVDILGMSALLTTTITQLPQTIEMLKKEGLRNKVKVMVGGVSVTPEYAKQIGADAYGKDAVEAVIAARKLVGK